MTLKSEQQQGVPDVSIVVPVYKSEGTIRELVEQLMGLASTLHIEIILVNDGSPDSSGVICRELLTTASVPLTMIEHARNYGEHNAVMSGMREAQGRYVVTMDDDLQNSPSAVQKLHEHAVAGDWDVVYARHDQKRHALWRNLSSSFANRAADVLLPNAGKVHRSTFRCISAFVVREITKYDGPFPYVDGLIMQVTDRASSVSVDHLPRVSGPSSYTLAKLLALWLSLATGYSLFPLRVATVIGAALMSLALLLAATISLGYAALGTISPTIAALSAAAVFLSGIQCLLLGIIGEYVGRSLLLLSRKPQAVVRSVEKRNQLPTGLCGNARG